VVDVQDLGSAVHGLFDLGLGNLGQLQAEGHVVEQVHVRVERVALEHHGNAAFGRRHVVDDAPADGQGAFGDVFQPGDGAQQGALAAAAGADEDHEFAVADLQIDAAQDLHFAVGLADPGQLHVGHVLSPCGPRVWGRFVENIQSLSVHNNPTCLDGFRRLPLKIIDLALH
jgi:hypothetical protein